RKGGRFDEQEEAPGASSSAPGRAAALLDWLEERLGLAATAWLLRPPGLAEGPEGGAGHCTGGGLTPLAAAALLWPSWYLLPLAPGPAAPTPGLATLAQEELDRCIEARTGGDVTRIVQRLFERQADLFPIRPAGGAYFTPQEHAAFVDKVQCFLG